MAERRRVDERLDELYREHPDGFVAGRDRLAKDLRDAGDREQADRLKKLRRPTVAAWAINRAALESPAQLQAFAEASRELEEAQARALEGGDEGAARWRAAAAREREATGAVVDAAEALASEGIAARVLNNATWRPLDHEALEAAARETGAIVVAEEHLVHCGLGAQIAQYLAGVAPVPLGYVGMKETYAES
ncbi:MAG: hypothetical protein GEU88_19700, partial [Solirubrobacterales bacterium]|nr:hypothetical protein [Solirubrobacterales bacterium]